LIEVLLYAECSRFGVEQKTKAKRVTNNIDLKSLGNNSVFWFSVLFFLTNFSETFSLGRWFSTNPAETQHPTMRESRAMPDVWASLDVFPGGQKQYPSRIP